MSEESLKPLVGVTTGVSLVAKRKVRHHGIAERYLHALARVAGVVPMLIPAIAEDTDVADLARRLDGLFLPGGRANVEPHHYGGRPFPDDEIRDPDRDALTLPLIRACIDRGVPVFGVCRGIQEMNVALGGTLHYRVHLVDGMLDHRRRHRRGIYQNRHKLILTAGGMFERLVGVSEVEVNSLHGQGIDRLADGLEIEATAPDGLVEGVCVAGARRFAVGVQWHAEAHHEEEGLSRELLKSFGAATRERQAERAATPTQRGAVRAA
jgi:putative glutamine amidotransferase